MHEHMTMQIISTENWWDDEICVKINSVSGMLNNPAFSHIVAAVGSKYEQISNMLFVSCFLCYVTNSTNLVNVYH